MEYIYEEKSLRFVNFRIYILKSFHIHKQYISMESISN